jgi:hypothetical protein
MYMSYSDNNSFVLFGIDKITLGIESHYLNYYKTPERLEKIIDIIQCGNWIELNIQLEVNGQSYINYMYPLASILQALLYGLSMNLFKEPLSSQLLNCINGIYHGLLYPYSFIIQFFNTGIFKLDEYELFFDCYGYNPFLDFDKSKFRFLKTTIYTKDYKKIKRSDGTDKGTRRSMLCFYDRGLKISSPYTINRIEFRICDERAKAILNPIDLFYSVVQFINAHSTQIKQTLKRYLPEGSITFNEDYINQNVPILSKLIWLL